MDLPAPLPASGITAAVAYRAGRRLAELPVDALGSHRGQAGTLLWVGLRDPDQALLDRVGGQLGLDRGVVEELARPHRRPKVIEFEGVMLVVAITIGIADHLPQFGELTLVIGQDFLLTLRRGPLCAYAPLRERLEAAPELLARGPDFVATELLDFLADQFVAVATALEEGVEQMEQRLVLHGATQLDIRRLYRMRRDLLRIHNAVSPLAEICRRLSRVESPVIDGQARPYFGEVADRAQRLVEWFSALRESLAFAFEAGLMIGQMQQNDTTRKLAAWAAILAVPTAIAGLYGMNFENMPELKWRYGYPAVLAVIAGAILFLYRRFRKSGWL
ncbi:magnesium and cobalt transport protein CorA [Roseomonas sp. 18066]|uniref:magnesium and cobalt transport protein CorA n=1 Tax=Roseomonas sp. 18066 TaxID=2681412 RepID=UPI00135C76AC|nr:magnesium and cobalt transport protein CorA [Roseomonas sp. 18066]